MAQAGITEVGAGVADPPLSEEIDPLELAPEVRAELTSLSRPVAAAVAGRLVATGQLLDMDADQALAHAFVARRLAPRISSVREAVGLAAYQAGEWQTALSELRAYHRMAGNLSHLSVVADCERALGRPERAIDLYRSADRDQLDAEQIVELLIVAAGARMDLGQADAAVAMLQVRELAAGTVEPWAARLRYAYADALLAAGRRDEAREWFARAAELDENLGTDAAERMLELDGIVIDDDDDDDDDDGPHADDDPDGDDDPDDDGPHADAAYVDIDAVDSDGDDDRPDNAGPAPHAASDDSGADRSPAGGSA